MRRLSTSAFYERGYRRYVLADDPPRRLPRAVWQSATRFCDVRFRQPAPSGSLDAAEGTAASQSALEIYDLVLCDISPAIIEEALRRWPFARGRSAPARRPSFSRTNRSTWSLAIDLVTHLRACRGITRAPPRRFPGRVERVLLDTTIALLGARSRPAYGGLPVRLLRRCWAGGVASRVGGLASATTDPTRPRTSIREERPASRARTSALRPCVWSEWHLSLVRCPT